MQEYFVAKNFELEKVATNKNKANICIKSLNAAAAAKYIRIMEFEITADRPTTAKVLVQ